MSEHQNRLDSGGLTYLLHRIKTIFTSMFQAKEAGKGLSTNDYTNAEKTKLAGIAEGATANVGTVTGITMNSTSKTVDVNGVVDLGTVITEQQDISGKADKDTNAVVGNFASFDASGNPVDSGHKHSDYITDVSDKADKVAGATNGHFAGLDNNGNLTDSGKSSSDFLASTLKGSVNGVAELDSNGIVPTSQLPSYVDDVVDGYFYDNKFYEDDQHTIEIPGESGKIYVDLSTNKTYRWSGTIFVVIASDLALGETDSTAYRGDRGAAAYAAAVTNVDSTPTSDSGNLVTSGGVYTSMNNKADKTDTVLSTTLSMGRKASTTVGTNSTALGYNVTASGDYSHAVGYTTKANSSYTHAEGYSSEALGSSAHAEGYSTTASGSSSHSEGYATTASGAYSHAEGVGTSNKGALGKADHAEGYQTIANSGVNDAYYAAHAEGYRTSSTAKATHAEGVSTTASGVGAHAEGDNTLASGNESHAEGQGGTFTLNGSSIVSKASANASHSEGYQTAADNYGAHSEGRNTRACGEAAHSEGYLTLAYGHDSHAEGYGGQFTIDETTYNSGAYGTADHSEGEATLANSGNNTHGAHAEGFQSRATGGASHAEGSTTLASGAYSHAEGLMTTASGAESHAEGQQTTASSFAAHAEGFNTTAAGVMSHTEGQATTTASSATFSHAEGNNTTVYGVMAHAEGEYTTAIGNRSHVEGGYTVAAGDYQHVIGTYNVVDSYSNRPEWQENTAYEVGDKVYVPNPSGRRDYGYTCKTAHTSGSTFDYSKWDSDIKMNYAEIIGNGTADDARSNARVLTWDGDERLKGNVYVECNSDSTGGTKLATVSQIPDVTGKADKVASATNGNFAGLDSNGNLTDSGHKHSDYLTSHQDITGKADKVTSATNGHFAGLNSNGNLTDSGKSATDFIASTAKGAVNGVAELDANGLVPTSQLPSYVDDVLEYANTSAFPATGEAGKIYIALDTNKTYRWSGSEYVEISASLALG